MITTPVWTHPLVRAGIVLGLGFGGFADGIVLHQILGWHHLVCVTAHCQPTSIEQLQLQNTQDGFFHLALWLVSLGGTAMLFRAARPAGPACNGRVLFGSMLAGWGLFNFIEGIIDHQFLGLHHVLPGHPHQVWFDLLFLAAGVVLFMIGARLIRSPGGASTRCRQRSAAFTPLQLNSAGAESAISTLQLLATLGWRTQSRWDWQAQHAKL